MKPTTRLSTILFAAGTLAAGLLASGLPISAQTVLIRDTFANNTTNRKAGDVLNGLAPEVGSGMWTANSNTAFGTATFSSTGNIAATSSVEYRIASSAHAEIMTLSADIKAGAAGWTSISFLNAVSSSTTTGWTTGGESLLRVRIQGPYYFLEVGTALGSGQALKEGNAGFSSAETYSVSLSLDTESSKVKLDISDSSGASVVATGWISTSLSDNAISSLSAVGFRLNGANATNPTLLDNFQLQTSATIPVPEPGNIAAFMGGLAILGLFAWKMTKC